MDNLYIDYEKGLALGTKIQEEAQELKVLINKLMEMQENIKVSLDSDEYDRYQKPLLTQTKIMYKLSDVVDETADFLVNVSSAYQELADTNYKNGEEGA